MFRKREQKINKKNKKKLYPHKNVAFFNGIFFFVGGLKRMKNTIP